MVGWRSNNCSATVFLLPKFSDFNVIGKSQAKL
jgi:hypothetical protein